MSTAVLDAPPAAPAQKYHPDELHALPDGGRGYELVNDELVELPVSYLSTFVAGRVYRQLANHAEDRRLGWVSPEGTSFRCFPDDRKKVRRADAAFTRLERYSPVLAVREGHCTVCPDLVVEVVSPGDIADDVNAKRLEWLAAGAQLVWVVFPHQQEVYAHTADGGVRLFRKADALTAEPVLPEFSGPVADLFALPAAGG